MLNHSSKVQANCIVLILAMMLSLMGAEQLAAEDAKNEAGRDSLLVEGDFPLGFFEQDDVIIQAGQVLEGLAGVAGSSAADADDDTSGMDGVSKSKLSDQVEAVINSELEQAATVKEEEKAPLAKDEQLFEAALNLFHELEFKPAIAAFVKVLNYEDVRPEFEKKALIYLARVYHRHNKPIRAISLLELYVATFPDDPKREEVIFEIGKIYRQIGQLDASIAAFYRVLNAIILAGEGGMDAYLEIARKAQFEIARSHFIKEEWVQAIDLFDRIALFELSDQDRETLRYYRARALIYVGRRAEGLSSIAEFIKSYPESPFLPELLYEKARAEIDMRQMVTGRQTLLDLLEMGGLPEDNMTSEWVEWRRIAGNFLANYYYKMGEFEFALRLYQAIVVMDESPRWQLPIVMQMASCFRELDRVDRAIESLDFVIGEVRSMREAAGVSELSQDFEFLEESASWQRQLLVWRQGMVAQLQAQDGAANP